MIETWPYGILSLMMSAGRSKATRRAIWSRRAYLRGLLGGDTTGGAFARTVCPSDADGLMAAPARNVGGVETSHSISFSVRAYVDLTRLRRVLDEEFERRGLALDERRALVLAVHEAAKNGLDGSDAQRRPVGVCVAFVDGHEVSICVSDQGEGFRLPHLACPPPLDEEHGRGLCLIRALVDSFAVERQGERTVVLLRKRLSTGTLSCEVA